MRILIIRHGDPDYAIDSLTEQGKIEAKLLAEKLKKEKIDAMYVSPLGRARKTCSYTEEAIGKTAEVLPWLREFSPKIRWEGEDRNRIAWDLLPADWKNEPCMYGDDWTEFKYYKNTDVKAEYDLVTGELDKLIERHGYKRNGKLYSAVRPNTDTIALFCHFGVESVLLSRLLDIPVPLLWHNTVALPSSVTTLFTEERREGVASFRMAGFGDLSHLYAGGTEPSFAARFCETFDSPDRHD